MEACLKDSYPKPTWRELGVAFRVLFYPHPEVMELLVDSVPVNVPVNDRQQWLPEQLAAGIRARASDLATHWGVAEKTAKRDIAYLKGRELIEFIGSTKKGAYRIRTQV